MADVLKEYEDSCVYKDAEKKVLKGHLAVNPAGGLVELPPGSVRPAVSLEKGHYIEGIKKGWRLGNQHDLERKAKEEEARQRKEAGEPAAVEKPKK